MSLGNVSTARYLTLSMQKLNGTFFLMLPAQKNSSHCDAVQASCKSQGIVEVWIKSYTPKTFRLESICKLNNTQLTELVSDQLFNLFSLFYLNRYEIIWSKMFFNFSISVYTHRKLDLLYSLDQLYSLFCHSDFTSLPHCLTDCLWLRFLYFHSLNDWLNDWLRGLINEWANVSVRACVCERERESERNRGWHVLTWNCRHLQIWTWG